MLCEWDVRSRKRPVSEFKAGGGVWRIRQHPTDPSLLALACMDGGFKVKILFATC